MSDVERSGGDDSGDDQARTISAIFGENILSLNNIKDYVTESTYQKIKGVILEQKQMDLSTTEEIARALRAARPPRR